MRIVFMGTPSFALPALQSLINLQYNIVAVYTKQPSYSGRSLKLCKSPIHILAESYNIPTFTPKTLKSVEEIDKIKSLKPDIGIVAAYGLILKKEVLQVPKFGFINIHPSDLPRWRGASPIQRTIMSGDTKTALCIMQMDEGVDTGDIIMRQEVPLDDDMTSHYLHDKMSNLGAEVLIKSLELFKNGKVTYRKQLEDNATYATKIQDNEERIDWNQNARVIHCKIRAFSPKPGAYFIHNNELIKIISANYENSNHNEIHGKVMDCNLKIACKDGFIIPTLLQRQGRKMIYTDAFLRGYSITQGTILQ